MRRSGPPPGVVISCEHASGSVPARLARRLGLSRARCRGHEGYDAGAAGLARRLARARGLSPCLGTVCRLVVDLNRSPSNPAVFAGRARWLDAADRAELLGTYHRPHWGEVRGRIETLHRAGRPVVHVGVHSFTPRWGGEVRPMDVGLLYDPARGWEREIARAWKAALARVQPRVVVRRNAPYRGTADGMTRALRRVWPDARYAGLELEVNQRWVRGERVAPWLAAALVRSFDEAMMGVASPAPGR